MHEPKKLSEEKHQELLARLRSTDELVRVQAAVRLTGSGVDPAVRPTLAAAMSRHAGVIRDHRDLEGLRQTLAQAPPAGRGLDLATVEATNLHAVSVLVAASALARAESRGCHRWRDVPPVRSAARARHTVMRVTGDQPLDTHSVRIKEGTGA